MRMPARFDPIVAVFVFGWPLLLCGVAIAAEAVSAFNERRRSRDNSRPGFEIIAKKP
jgi:hypothetical protein